MGIARGRFVVDTHVHAQRHALKFKERGVKPSYIEMGDSMVQIETYDNSPRLLYDMDRYGVDMCIIQPAFGMNNKINGELVQKYPDKFVATCNDVETKKRGLLEEKEWTVEEAVKEIDTLLSTGLYQAGIGEALPFNPSRETYISWPERREEICSFFELARKHKVPISWHTGLGLSYYASKMMLRRKKGSPEYFDPSLAQDILPEYPDVPVILAHGGMQAGWSERFIDEVCYLASNFDNAYLETGLYWAELYEKALLDPNIGVNSLLWGTDWGASIPIYTQPGHYPSSYPAQVKKKGPPSHQVDIFGWSLRQLDKLELDQDDLNLILGGNAARVFKLKTPYTRLFKEYPAD